MKITRIKLALIFLFLIITFRLPFLSFPLVREEGTHSLLLLENSYSILPMARSQSKDLSGEGGGCRLLVAQSDNNYIWAPPERNILPYFLMCEVIGPIASKFYSRADGITSKTILSRTTFFSIALIGYIFISLAIVQNLNIQRSLYLLAIGLVAIGIFNSPLFIGASIQPQLDGAIGLTIFSILIWATTKDNKFPHQWYLFFGTFLLAFGKNEWGYAVLAALFMISILRLIVNSFIPTFIFKEVKLNGIIYIYTGILSAITFAYLYSPNDYLLWFGLVNRINRINSNIVLNFTNNIHYLYPILIIFALSILIFIINIRKKIYDEKSLFWTFVGAFIFLGYFKSGWSGDGFPRYYVPAGVAFFGAFLCGYRQLASDLNSLIIKCLIPIFLLIIVLNIIFIYNSFINYVSITSKPGLNLSNFNKNISGLKDNYKNNEIYFYDSSIGYYYPEIPFISSDLGIDGAKEMVRKHFNNKELVIVK